MENLTDNDRQRIEQEADITDTWGLSSDECFKAGAEYEHKYQREQQAKRIEELEAACYQLINCDHQEHFAVRLNDSEMKGIEMIKKALSYANKRS